MDDIEEDDGTLVSDGTDVDDPEAAEGWGEYAKSACALL